MNHPSSPDRLSTAEARQVDARQVEEQRAAALRRYWRANLRCMLALLAVWALVGPGLSILFVEPLNRFHLGGFPLGFWFAQQGSIIVFVILIAVYALVMNSLDARHRRELASVGHAEAER